MQTNFESLAKNPYPGRGLIQGVTPKGALAQVYWIMGRSENSRNRIFVREGACVKTQAYDESRMTDPSLIIYYPLRAVGRYHILTNGDQTDTIRDNLAQGGGFEAALLTRTYEPDGPNFTPRISGMITLDENPVFSFSILKTLDNDEHRENKTFWRYTDVEPGTGFCIHTYEGDGVPLPSFNGAPYPLPLYDGVEELAQVYWDILDRNNRVSLLAKTIDPKSGAFDLHIINRFG